MGLGNPDPAYRLSPHNVGFECIQEINLRLNAGAAVDLGSVILRRGEHAGRSYVLARPQTWMNASGRGVERLLRYLESDVKDLVVITDDMDLPLGAVRVRPGGGAGTHRGMQSLVETLGRKDFARIRIGIHPGAPGPVDLAQYVLTPMAGPELDVLNTGITRAAEAALDLLQCKDIDAVMNRTNRRYRRRDGSVVQPNTLFAPPEGGGCRPVSRDGAAHAASIQKEEECIDRMKSGS